MQLTVVQLFVGLMVAVIASQEPQERDFMRWLRERGIKFNGLELANFAKHGRGVRTRRFVRQHETFLHVPANATISPIIARDHFRRIAPPGTDLAAKPCELSILFVMREALRVTTHGGRREPPLPPSEWSPYIRMLPAHLPIPVFYAGTQHGSSALQILLDTPTSGQRIKNRLDRIDAQRNDLAERVWLHPRWTALFPAPSGATLASNRTRYTQELAEIYRWSVAVIVSRAWSAPVFLKGANASASGGVDTGVQMWRDAEFSWEQCKLVPLMDMLNHDLDRGSLLASVVAQRASRETGQVRAELDGVMRAALDVAAGEQIFDAYHSRTSSKCNLDLLWSFGFTEAATESSFDCAFLSLTPSGDEESVSRKLALIRELRLGDAGLAAGLVDSESGYRSELQDMETKRGKTIHVVLRADRGLSPAALLFIRISVSTPHELQQAWDAWRESEQRHTAQQMASGVTAVSQQDGASVATRALQALAGVFSLTNELRAVRALRNTLSAWWKPAQMMADLARVRQFEGKHGLPLSFPIAGVGIDAVQSESVDADVAGVAGSLSSEVYSALRVRIGEQHAIHRGLQQCDELWNNFLTMDSFPGWTEDTSMGSSEGADLPIDAPSRVVSPGTPLRK